MTHTYESGEISIYSTKLPAKQIDAVLTVHYGLR